MEARRLEIEQGAEAAQRGIGSGPARGLGERGDRSTSASPRVDVDAGVLVGQCIFAGFSGHCGRA